MPQPWLVGVRRRTSEDIKEFQMKIEAGLKVRGLVERFEADPILGVTAANLYVLGPAT